MIYLRKREDPTTLQLIYAKFRVAPVKAMSTSRLEHAADQFNAVYGWTNGEENKSSGSIRMKLFQT